MPRLAEFLVLISIIIAAIAGCGAHSSFTVSTDGNGSLAGVSTVPADGEVGVPTDVWVRVYWPAGYEPPSEFTFRLRDEDGDSVMTYKHNGDEPYEWWFEPYLLLDYDTRYKIELVSEDERVSFYFYTREEGIFRGPEQDFTSEAGPRVSPALDEHRIVTAN